MSATSDCAELNLVLQKKERMGCSYTHTHTLSLIEMAITEIRDQLNDHRRNAHTHLRVERLALINLEGGKRACNKHDRRRSAPNT